MKLNSKPLTILILLTEGWVLTSGHKVAALYRGDPEAPKARSPVHPATLAALKRRGFVAANGTTRDGSLTVYEITRDGRREIDRISAAARG